MFQLFDYDDEMGSLGLQSKDTFHHIFYTIRNDQFILFAGVKAYKKSVY